jgi:Mg/Co/Ni transporter MgtE
MDCSRDRVAELERLLSRAALIGAACGLVWGAFLGYLIAGHIQSGGEAILAGLMFTSTMPGVGAISAMIAVLGFRVITRRR